MNRVKPSTNHLFLFLVCTRAPDKVHPAIRDDLILLLQKKTKKILLAINISTNHPFVS